MLIFSLKHVDLPTYPCKFLYSMFVCYYLSYNLLTLTSFTDTFAFLFIPPSSNDPVLICEPDWCLINWTDHHGIVSYRWGQQYRGFAAHETDNCSSRPARRQSFNLATICRFTFVVWAVQTHPPGPLIHPQNIFDIVCFKLLQYSNIYLQKGGNDNHDYTKI